MAAMTMNVLKWRPKFGLCFWNIQFNLHIIVTIFYYTYCLFFHGIWIVFDNMYILAYLNIIIAIFLNGPWGRSIWGRWPYIIHIYTYIYKLCLISWHSNLRPWPRQVTGRAPWASSLEVSPWNWRPSRDFSIADGGSLQTFGYSIYPLVI